jgi:hypothetical protein
VSDLLEAGADRAAATRRDGALAAGPEWPPPDGSAQPDAALTTTDKLATRRTIMSGLIKKLGLKTAPSLKKTAQRLVTCPLTEEEQREKGHLLAACCVQQTEIEKEKSDVMKQFKERLDAVALDIAKHTKALRNGTEVRQITVQELYDYHDGTVTITRKDTGELIEKRDMTADERQIGLDLLIADAPASAEKVAHA